MNHAKIKESIRKCHHCKAAITSDAYSVFPKVSGEELASIQAAHAEEMLKIYRRLEGDLPVDKVNEETIATSITALLDLATLNHLQINVIVQKVIDSISIDFARSGV